jgi:hypothetical protein
VELGGTVSIGEGTEETLLFEGVDLFCTRWVPRAIDRLHNDVPMSLIQYFYIEKVLTQLTLETTTLLVLKLITPVGRSESRSRLPCD